jgi:molybdate transport system substrate-binding protein
LWATSATAGADELLVSAAASLTDAFTDIGAAYTKANPGTTVRFNFASSGALAQQIEAGAPVDVFASASPQEMDLLEKHGRIEKPTRTAFAGNGLVLIAPASSRLRSWEDLRAAAVRRVALADPDSVPAGRYGKETMVHRRLWDAVKHKAVYGEHVRQVLAYVAGGDVDAGIVFATDAQVEPHRVRVVQAAVGGKDHSPIAYPAAVVRNAPDGPAARRFVTFLKGPVAQGILRKYGFLRPPRGGKP